MDRWMDRWLMDRWMVICCMWGEVIYHISTKLDAVHHRLDALAAWMMGSGEMYQTCVHLRLCVFVCVGVGVCVWMCVGVCGCVFEHARKKVVSKKKKKKPSLPYGVCWVFSILAVCWFLFWKVKPWWAAAEACLSEHGSLHSSQFRRSLFLHHRLQLPNHSRSFLSLFFNVWNRNVVIREHTYTHTPILALPSRCGATADEGCISHLRSMLSLKSTITVHPV